MDLEDRAWRVGLTALLTTLLVRLWAMGMPQRVVSWLTEPNIAKFLIYLETGRDVRFSPSQETVPPNFGTFTPDYMESPAAASESDPLPPFLEPVQLMNTSGKKVQAEALLEEPLTWSLRGEEPTVLILHTHSTESYTQRDEPYREVSAWRTLDERYNMLSIGQEVASLLAQAGIPTVQDRGYHDYPSYNGSYVDARASLQAYLEEYPSIELVLDLHRDAAGSGSNQLRTLAQVEGADSAQLMIVLGTNHDQYEKNLALALKLHAVLEKLSPGIMRPLQLRPQRFNQDLSSGALLIEVGAAGNAHDEALRAAGQLAKAIIALADGTAGMMNAE